MREADNMTGAELQTLREACGLSRDELGARCDVAARTVKHWENGRAGVPADVAALVARLDAQNDSDAWEALSRIKWQRERLRTEGKPAPGVIALVRARSEEDVLEFASTAAPDDQRAPGISWPALGGAVARLAALLSFQGDHIDGIAAKVRVIWFAPSDYAAWLAAQNASHGGDRLQAWALAQIPAQSIPHRADQPPA